MRIENKIVNSLWIGKKLSSIELLTLHSFTSQGHIFQLWTYNDLDNNLPDNVILKDANKIIPAAKIFRKKNADPLNNGNGKGGVTLFADIFRCKLLLKEGGWWVDMDILCLQPFDFSEEYFFRPHPYLPMVNNVIKCPKGCKLMKLAYEETYEKTNANTTNYLLPNDILNEKIVSLGLDKYIRENVCNREWWADIEHFIFSKKTPPNNWYFIHWINEEWRTQKLDKNKIYRNSTIGFYMNKYGIKANMKIGDLKYFMWHVKKNSFVQKLRPLFRNTPIHALYKYYF